MLSALAAGCAGSAHDLADGIGRGTPLRVGVAVVDVTPTSWERFQDVDGNGLWDFAGGEPFDDFGSDGVPSTSEPGFDPVFRPDPEGDDFDPISNPAGTEGNGRFEPIWMAGFDNAHPALGVHDPITVRALAFQQGDVTAVVVACDFVGLLTPSFEPALARLESEAGVDPRRVIVASIHDHEGPDTLGLWGKTQYESGIDPRYQARVNDAIVEATTRAVAGLTEARLKVADVALDLGLDDRFLDHRHVDPANPPRLANDTRLPTVRDGELLAIQALATGGETIATLVSWSNHPESIGSRNNLLSADYPGYLRAHLERRLGGTAVYVSGAVGGLLTPLDGAITPYWSDVGERSTDPTTGLTWIADDGFEKARSLGFELAEQAADALSGVEATEPDQLRFRRRESRLPMENLNLVLGLVAGVIPGSASYFTRDGAGLFDFSEPDHCSHCGCIRTPIFRLDLGRLASLVTAPGELFPESLDGRAATRYDFATPEFDYAPSDFPAIEGLRRMDGAPGHLALIGLAPNELGYFVPRSDYLDFSVSDFLFGGGPGSPMSHPNFYSEYFSLGPRAGDELYCDLIDILDLAPAPETAAACAATRRSTFVENGADGVCKVVRALPGPLTEPTSLGGLAQSAHGGGA